MTNNFDSVRQQARFVPQVVLPTGLCRDTWYDVASGRRHDDARPGMVLLEVDGRRAHFPSGCLEFRAAPPAAGRVPKPSRRLLAVAASLVPLAAFAALAASRFPAYR